MAMEIAQAPEGGWLPGMEPADWMMLLLGADNGSPILGKTSFVKQLFVLGKEVISDIDRKFAFYPSKYGPYSRIFESALRDIMQRGWVTERRVMVGASEGSGVQRSDFMLTPAGVEVAENLLRRMPRDLRENINQYKRVMSGLGLWGLIQYVYSSYPEYAVLSELRPG